jgi:hypothetical protein
MKPTTRNKAYNSTWSLQLGTRPTTRHEYCNSKQVLKLDMKPATRHKDYNSTQNLQLSTRPTAQHKAYKSTQRPTTQHKHLKYPSFWMFPLTPFNWENPQNTLTSVACPYGSCKVSWNLTSSLSLTPSEVWLPLSPSRSYFYVVTFLE